MSLRPPLLGAAVALASAAAGTAVANPVDAFGFGARSIGMGSAATATADDVSAVYYNPAGLAAGDALRFELGWASVDPDLRLSGGDLDVDASRGFQGGFALPGDVLGRRVGFSIGLHLPDRQVTRVRALPQGQPRFVRYDNEPQRIVLSAGLAAEVVPGLFAGAGLTFLSNAVGVLDIQGRVDVFDEEETFLSTSVREDLTAKRYPTFGLLWKGDGPLRAGAVWREEFFLRLDVDVQVRGDLVAGGEPFIQDASFDVLSINHNLFSPRQVVLGLAWEEPAWTLALDVGWLQWSRFPSPTASVDIDFEIPGIDAAPPPLEVVLDPRFHDIVVPRLGGERVLVDRPGAVLRARGGLFYEPTPAPDQPGRTNYVDQDKLGLSAGLGLELDLFPEVLPKPVSLDLAGLLVWMPERVYRKSDPADPVGDYTATGLLLGGSATVSFLF